MMSKNKIQPKYNIFDFYSILKEGLDIELND